MCERNYFEEYKQMYHLSMILGVIITILICGILGVNNHFNNLEKNVMNKEVIEIEDTRYICNAIETKEVVWKKIN